MLFRKAFLALVCWALLFLLVQCRDRDVKRLLANRVIRKANNVKERSLHEVLRDFRLEKDTKHERRKAKSASRGSLKSEEERNTEESRNEGKGKPMFRTMSEMFAWAINSTVAGHFIPKGNNSKAAWTIQHENIEREKVKPSKLHRRASQQVNMLPESKVRTQKPSSTSQKAEKVFQQDQRAHRAMKMPVGLVESPLDVMIRAVAVIKARHRSATQKVKALLLIEDMCHSVDNGRDLTLRHVGGVASLVHALANRNDHVRATASWALATCAMNNGPVQNASATLGAVETLVRLAARDRNGMVRSRALLALNAVLEYEEARERFRKTPNALEMLRRALDNADDIRAVRRALNLGELLVRTDLSLWKVELEAWDIPQRVATMLVHRNLDVRESAARLVSALDGDVPQ